MHLNTSITIACRIMDLPDIVLDYGYINGQ